MVDKPPDKGGQYTFPFFDVWIVKNGGQGEIAGIMGAGSPIAFTFPTISLLVFMVIFLLEFFL
ncbi:MAG: hypothetical protein RBR71_11570, partial [Gudongella sp.]|nr:hypothetical protein [Gudongella sp.]